MKQATNPFAPVPLWRKRLPGYAAMGAATVAMAIGLIAMQNARTTVAGTLLPVSEADAAAYGISAVYQLDNGSYRVEGSQKGFQSDVQAAVTLDAEGNVSAVEILSQAETDSLGGQCVNPEFTSQYQGAAPFTLAGKSYTVTDPLPVPPMPLPVRRMSSPLLRRILTPRSGTCPTPLPRPRPPAGCTQQV